MATTGKEGADELESLVKNTETPSAPNPKRRRMEDDPLVDAGDSLVPLDVGGSETDSPFDMSHKGGRNTMTCVFYD